MVYYDRFAQQASFTSADIPCSVYAESGDESQHNTAFLIKTADPGTHVGRDSASLSVSARPVGSGNNIPGNADFGMQISAIKHNYTDPSTSAFGEVSGLSVVVRQGGPLATDIPSGANRNDSNLIEGNGYNVLGTGYIAGVEMSVGNLDPNNGFAIHKDMHFEVAAFNGDSDDNAFGLVLEAQHGTLDCSLQIQASGSAGWANAIACVNNAASVYFNVDGIGNVTAAGKIAGGDFWAFGLKVVGARIGGWGTPTNNSRITDFNASTASLLQTAQTVAQLITDLKTHGLLGA